MVGYTITVTNSGQTPYTGATFTDPLTGVLDDAVYNADAAATAGTVSYASPNLTWTGNLAVGATATITYSVTVNNPDTGGKILANTVTSTTPGSNCAGGGNDPRCTATVDRAWPEHYRVRRRDTTPGRHGALHDHGDQLRADRLHRGDVHRPADQRAGQRRLQRQRDRDRRHRRPTPART